MLTNSLLTLIIPDFLNGIIHLTFLAPFIVILRIWRWSANSILHGCAGWPGSILVAKPCRTVYGTERICHTCDIFGPIMSHVWYIRSNTAHSTAEYGTQNVPYSVGISHTYTDSVWINVNILGCLGYVGWLGYIRWIVTVNSGRF